MLSDTPKCRSLKEREKLKARKARKVKKYKQPCSTGLQSLGVSGVGHTWEGCALSQPGSEQVVTDPAGAGLQARDSNAEHSYVQRHSNGSESGVQNAKKVNSEW